MNKALGMRLVLLLLSAAVLTSCAQLLGGNTEIPQRRFYTISVEPIRRQLRNSERPYAFSLQVKTFDVQRHYNRNEIIFRRDRYELQRDALHSWAVRPGDLITDAVQQYIREANLFTNVGGDRDFLERRPDYALTGTVKILERFDSGDMWAAHISMSMQLSRHEDGQVIWRRSFDKERDVFNPDMTHTIAAFSEILRSQMELYISEIDLLFLKMKRGDDAIGAQTAVVLSDTAIATTDTTGQMPDETSYYIILPGKLAP